MGLGPDGYALSDSAVSNATVGCSRPCQHGSCEPQGTCTCLGESCIDVNESLSCTASNLLGQDGCVNGKFGFGWLNLDLDLAL